MSPVRRTPEGELLHSICEYLKARGVSFRRVNVVSSLPGGRRRHAQNVGMSDIIGVLRPSGRYLAIEVKRDGQKATAAQTEFLYEIVCNGGVAFVAHSVDEVAEVLRDAESEAPRSTTPGR